MFFLVSVSLYSIILRTPNIDFRILRLTVWVIPRCVQRTPDPTLVLRTAIPLVKSNLSSFLKLSMPVFPRLRIRIIIPSIRNNAIIVSNSPERTNGTRESENYARSWLPSVCIPHHACVCDILPVVDNVKIQLQCVRRSCIQRGPPEYNDDHMLLHAPASCTEVALAAPTRPPSFYPSARFTRLITTEAPIIHLT